MRIFFLFFILFSKAANSFDASGLQVSLAGDFLYSQGLNSSSSADDKLLMRGAEMSFYAPIDYQFDGLISAAAHDEAGETIFELHEMVLSSSKMIERSHFKVGQFFLGVGKLNHQHQHDWSFTRAPYYHEAFFDSEGAIDTGLEYHWLLPTEDAWSLTAGITSGHRWGHSHTTGAKPKIPTHYLRLSSFLPFTRVNGIEFGMNYLGRKNAQSIRTQLFGFDMTAKIREGKLVKHKLLHELWLQQNNTPLQETQNQLGGYFHYAYGLNDEFTIGSRFDFFKDFDKNNSLTGKTINNILYTISPDITYNSSEFAKIRTTFSHQFVRQEGTTSQRDTRVELQFVFIIGGHPAHEF